MATYEKQEWDTTSYVNPTRMNHIENGIDDAVPKSTENYQMGTFYIAGTQVTGMVSEDDLSLGATNDIVLDFGGKAYLSYDKTVENQIPHRGEVITNKVNIGKNTNAITQINNTLSDIVSEGSPNVFEIENGTDDDKNKTYLLDNKIVFVNSFYVARRYQLQLKGNTDYVFSTDVELTSGGAYAGFSAGGTNLGNINATNSGKYDLAITTPSNGLVEVAFCGTSGDSSGKFGNIMLQEGTTATPYQPPYKSLTQINQSLSWKHLTQMTKNDDVDIPNCNELYIVGSNNSTAAWETTSIYTIKEFINSTKWISSTGRSITMTILFTNNKIALEQNASNGVEYIDIYYR